MATPQICPGLNPAAPPAARRPGDGVRGRRAWISPMVILRPGFRSRDAARVIIVRDTKDRTGPVLRFYP